MKFYKDKYNNIIVLIIKFGLAIAKSRQDESVP